MRLLVSVASASEASAALLGGADFVDAKDPLRGSLGPVSIDVLREIHVACAGARPVTAALGNATDEAEIERRARDFSTAGATLVKMGFAGITSAERVGSLIAAAVRGASAAGTVGLPPPSVALRRVAPNRSEGGEPDTTYGVIAVAYADAERVGSISLFNLLEVAARGGAKGVLIDTADKHGPGLRELVAPDVLGTWIVNAHEYGLLVAVAGKLTADDLPIVRDMDADVAGVRGAACDEGRTGRVVTDKVRVLRARCDAKHALT
jgi:(5-formylfuran-3-yl)methyl phosphate synthase